MTGVLVLPGTAPEQEWLNARRRGVTASEVPILMGLSPWSSPYALYWQKAGDLNGQFDNMAMALGRHLESFVAGQFSELHPEFYVQGDGRSLYAHPDEPWQLATPDRMLYDWGRVARTGEEFSGAPLAVLECKTTASYYDGWGDDGSDVIPVHYRCQVLWQMDVMGVGTGFVACLFMNARQLRVYELTMDAQAIQDLYVMRGEALQFLERIDLGDPPDVDWRPATRDALKHLNPAVDDTQVAIPNGMAQAWQAACGRYETAKQRKALFENRIRERLGTGHKATTRAGDVVARRDVYDVAAHPVKGFHVDKLVPVKPKEKP